MENNEFTMFMDVKMDIHDKRPDAPKFKQWTRCEVKIEAIKCLPCFLRVTLKACEDEAEPMAKEVDCMVERSLSVSINIPGVTISLAASRTKQHSYGLFWTQNRKNCFIYFALETESSCRCHMKWVKKSIKNLELYRQVCLEQRRCSRDTGSAQAPLEADHQQLKQESVLSQLNAKCTGKWQHLEEAGLHQCTQAALGPLPQIPDTLYGTGSCWSRRVSHASEIYEEIFEGSIVEPTRLSRRLSRASIASGIYEEMKPLGQSFNVIIEEAAELSVAPPPLPPLPPPRKRINTFEAVGLLGEIPRSNTNPESELAKKKKYKNMLDNIFGSGRSKRAESVSETQACTAEDLINCVTPPKHCKKQAIVTPTYANDMIATKRSKKKQSLQMTPVTRSMSQTKRHSFSSPDLSKINFLDTFDEDKVADMLNNTFSHSDDLNLSNESLTGCTAAPTTPASPATAIKHPNQLPTEASAALNVSQQIPQNFNFSACNISTVNLVGANGATVALSNNKNKIVADDLSGYCVMAPIIKKTNAQPTSNATTSTEFTSSGYSTGSYASTASKCTHSIEERLGQAPTAQPPPMHGQDAHTVALDINASIADENAIYEKMHATLNSTNTSVTKPVAHMVAAHTTLTTTADFSGNLYENLLTVKASQELEKQLPAVLSTSTPTESPQATIAIVPKEPEDEESYYQTPRKSIISVDEKIPSYYPNSCDTAKVRRHHTVSSPNNSSSPNCAASTHESIAATTVGFHHLVSLKMRRERKENLYISSPQSIIEQRHNCSATTESTAHQLTLKTRKTKKPGALKIAEHVYAVKHPKQKNTNRPHNNNNDINQPHAAGLTDDMKERLQSELLQLAMLQKIDFRFDDAATFVEEKRASVNNAAAATLTPPKKQSPSSELLPDDSVYENLLQRYTNTLLKFNQAPLGSNRTATMPKAAQHHLQVHQASNVSPAGRDTVPSVKLEMHQSCTGSVRVADAAAAGEQLLERDDGVDIGATVGDNGAKKFASLPRFKKIDFSPLRLKINNVLQRNQHQEF